MKIKIDVTCSPEEARAFLGLPDVAPMQKRMMDEVEQRMMANIKSMDPEAMIRTWLPASMQNLEQLQKMFWSQMTAGSRKKGEGE